MRFKAKTSVWFDSRWISRGDVVEVEESKADKFGRMMQLFDIVEEKIPKTEGKAPTTVKKAKKADK